MQSAFFTIISSAENPFIMTVFTGQRWCWASVHVMFCVPGNCNMLMLQLVFSLFQVLSSRLTSNVEMGTCIAKPTILEHPFVSQHEAYMQIVVPSLWCQFCGAVMAVWSSLLRRNHSQGSLECCQASVQIGLSECIQGWLAGENGTHGGQWQQAIAALSSGQGKMSVTAVVVMYRECINNLGAGLSMPKHWE